MMKQFLFIIFCIFHILIWLFVLFAFLNKTFAKINLFVIIPFIYIIHIFPFHFILKAKELLYPTDSMERADRISEILVIPILFTRLQTFLETRCFGNPIGPQGLLILGAVTSSFRLFF